MSGTLSLRTPLLAAVVLSLGMIVAPMGATTSWAKGGKGTKAAGKAPIKREKQK